MTLQLSWKVRDLKGKMEPGFYTVDSVQCFSIDHFHVSALESPHRPVLKDWKHKLILASWAFPDRIQINESSHTQVTLWHCAHCLFIQLLLQSPLFGGTWINLISLQVMTNPNFWTMKTIFCILLWFDSYTISLLMAQFLSEKNSTLKHSWAWSAMKSHCL